MPDDDERRLRVVVGDASGRPVAARGLAGWLAAVAPARARGVVSIAIVSDQRIRALNSRYRHKDVATDVLSFPSTRHPVQRTRHKAPRTHHPARSTQHPHAHEFLGEIVIARGVARRQARAAGHRDATELRILALHGLLHLLGYDHERDNGAMQRVERRLRRKGGLREGLIERSGALRRGAA